MSSAPQEKEPSGEAEGEEAPKKGKKKLVIIAAVVLLVAVGAGLFLSGALGGKEEKGAEHDAAAAGEHGAAPKEGEAAKPSVELPTYYELPQFLVNLNSATNHVSFLKMSVTLELRDKAVVPIMDANKPRVIDTFNTYLRELRPSDIQGSAGVYHLRNELLTRLNGMIEEGAVKDILFGEIIVQ